MRKNWIITLAAASAIGTFSFAQATGGGGAATGGNAGGVSGPMPGMSTGVDADGGGGAAATTGGTGMAGGAAGGTGGSAQTAAELQSDAAQLEAGIGTGSSIQSDATVQQNQRLPRASGANQGVGLGVGSDMQGTGAGLDIDRNAQPAALRGEMPDAALHGLTTATEASGQPVPRHPNLNLPAGSDMQGTNRTRADITIQPDTGRIDTSGTEGSVNIGSRDTTISEPAPGNEVQPAPGAPSANVITAPGGAFQGADPTAGDATVGGNFGNVGSANDAVDTADINTAQPAGGSVGATTGVTAGGSTVTSETTTSELNVNDNERQVGVGQVSSDFGDANVVAEEDTGVQGRIDVDQATRELSIPAAQIPRAQGGLSDMPPLATPPADQTAPRVLTPPMTGTTPQPSPAPIVVDPPVTTAPPVIVDPAAQPAGAQVQPLPTQPRTDVDD